MITGKVTTTTGEPLSYANVYLSDAAGNPAGNIGTTTNASGSYVLQAANIGLFVSASFVGYERKTVQITSQIQNFSLQSGINMDVTEIIDKPDNSKAYLLLIFAVIGLATIVK